MDSAAEVLALCREALDSAVEQERYSDAAQLKREVDAAAAKDVVGEVLRVSERTHGVQACTGCRRAKGTACGCLLACRVTSVSCCLCSKPRPPF